MNLPVLNKRRSVSKTPGRLSEVPAGMTVTVTGLDELPSALRQSLLAYGILPGRPVRVIARSPVLVLEVEHTELALEIEIARAVKVASQWGTEG